MAGGVIGRYGGTVEKFIGDAVMAVWGAPTAHEDDAERAVRAALELVSGTFASTSECHHARRKSSRVMRPSSFRLPIFSTVHHTDVTYIVL